MDDFSDNNGEGEFSDFLEELGERESESLLESVESSKTIKKRICVTTKRNFCYSSIGPNRIMWLAGFFWLTYFFWYYICSEQHKHSIEENYSYRRFPWIKRVKVIK
ncbi:hypothetical protein PGC35_20060 [Psychrobacillus sp. PGGUH221]|uniref:hypothetical protein n=1 Tax=Psychrobacillus sp. PGGUH221 TaxID=3020058 RepID=UPI0035C7183F